MKVGDNLEEIVDVKGWEDTTRNSLFRQLGRYSITTTDHNVAIICSNTAIPVITSLLLMLSQEGSISGVDNDLGLCRAIYLLWLPNQADRAGSKVSFQSYRRHLRTAGF